MKILICHSRYRSGPSSGENRVVEDEVRLLRDAGHDVELVSSEPASGPAGAARAAVTAVYGAAAVRAVRERVGAGDVDVVHVHNLFPQLSPAVLKAARGAGAGVVMTLHNFRAMCLPATLLRDGRVCEDCVGRVPWRGVVRRCYRGSAAGSATLATSLTAHRALRSFDAVDAYLAVSSFVRDKHIESGAIPERIRVKPNFAWPATRRTTTDGPLLFLGRVSPEKGLDVLLRAHRPAHGSLIVVGDGPALAEARSHAGDQVRFLGAVGADEVPALLAGAKALVVPSVWYEGAPRVIAEAYAAGVPVVASRIGGLPEAVVPDQTGLLVPPGDADALRGALDLLDDATVERLGAGASAFWQQHYSPERALAMLEQVYAEVADMAKTRGVR